MPSSTALDPSVLQRNLLALDHSQPAIASQVRSVDATAAEFSIGRDGSPTFRLRSDGRSVWLGHSSMPAISSPALMAEFDHGSGNVLLPGLGHGGETAELLSHMATHQAVFAWETDPLVPALAFRLHDFSEEIRAGRLVIVLGPDLLASLTASFDDYPTHLPPSRLFSAPHLPSQDIHRLQSQAESAAVRQNARLNAALTSVRVSLKNGRVGGTDGDAIQADAPIAAQPPAPGPRVLILSMMIDPRTSEIAAGLARAAEELMMTAHVHTPDRPANVHLAAGAQCLRRHQPTHVILLDQVAGEWGDLLDHVPNSVSWCVSPSAIRPELLSNLGSVRQLFAATPELVTQLQTPGSQPSVGRAVELLGPAADGVVFRPIDLEPADRRRFGSDIAIVLDAAYLAPEALGLKWESHKQLFNELTTALRAAPRRLDVALADALFAKTLLRMRTTFDAAELRRSLCRELLASIEPTLAALALLPPLLRRGYHIKIWGTGWAHHQLPTSIQVLPKPTNLDRNMIYNASAVLLHLRNDHLHDQHLLDALASGASILHRPLPSSQSLANKPILSNLPTFTAAEECPSLLRQLQDPTSRAKTQLQAAHSVVRADHLLKSRLLRLLNPFDPF